MPTGLQQVDLLKQTREQAALKSAGCVLCHKNVGDPHVKDTLQLGCCDCHGGDPATNVKEKAHVHPRFPDAWPTSANPVRSYTLLNHEVAGIHPFRQSRRSAHRPSQLRHGRLPSQGSAAEPQEHDDPRLHALGRGPVQQRRGPVQAGSLRRKLQHARRAAADADRAAADRRKQIRLQGRGPLPRSAAALRNHPAGQHPAHLRARRPVPPRDRHPRSARKSPAGRGPASASAAWAPRTAPIPVFISLQKTRLLDPTLNFLGTNDHPGDYRSSGCTACHVIYANDRSPVHSGPYARSGHLRPEPQPRPDHPQGRAGPSDRAPLHARPSRPASASSATSTPAPTS